MKTFLLIFSGVIIGIAITVTVYAGSTFQNPEYIFNRVFDSSTNTLRVIAT